MKVTYMISAPHCPWNNIDRQENCPGGRIVKIIGSGGSTPPLGTREHLKITAMKVNRNYRFVLTVVKMVKQLTRRIAQENSCSSQSVTIIVKKRS